MLKRKCFRCGEETSTLWGGIELKDEFLCEKCKEKAIKDGEISRPREGTSSYISIGFLRFIDVVYIVYSLIICLKSPGELIFNTLVTPILVFFVVWVLTVIAKIAIKIYDKVNEQTSDTHKAG